MKLLSTTLALSILVWPMRSVQASLMFEKVFSTGDLYTPDPISCKDVKKTAETTAESVSKPFSKDVHYRFDRERIVVAHPATVEVLADTMWQVQLPSGEKKSIRLKAGERFESSESISVRAQDGSECIAQVHGEAVYPTDPECFWLSGFSSDLRAGKYNPVSNASAAETWFHISTDRGASVGWCLQTWNFPAD